MNYRVYSTVATINSNKTYAEFLNVFNMVFPLKIENEYVELANLVIDYYKTIKKMELLKNQGINNSNEVDIEVELCLTRLKEAVASLNGNSHSFDYDNIETLLDLAKKAAKNKEETRSSIEQQSLQYENSETVADSVRKDLAVVIGSLNKKLEDVRHLDINDNRRITNLCVTERHLSIINGLNITDEEKNVLAKLLQSYLSVRVAAFKVVENVAEQMVTAYKRRETLDSNSFEYKNGLSAVLALYNIQIGDSIMANVISPLVCNSLYAQCLMMDVIAGFFNTGVIDSKLVEEIELSGQMVDYEVKESYLNVISLASTMTLNDQEQKR